MRVLFVPEERYPSNEAAMEGLFTRRNDYFDTYFLMRTDSVPGGCSGRWGVAHTIVFRDQTRFGWLNTFKLYFFDTRYVWQMVKALRLARPDYVIVRDMTFPLFVAFLLSYFYKFRLAYQKSHPFEVRNQSAQFVSNFRLSRLYRLLRRIDSYLLHRMLRACDAVLPISSTMAEDLESKHAVSPEKIHVLTMGVDHYLLEERNTGADETVRRAKPSLSEYRLIYIGTLSEDRDLNILIRGFARFLANSKTSAHLTFVGGTDSQITDLKKLVIQENLENAVSFLGYLARDSVFKLCYESDVGMAWAPPKSRYVDAFPTKMIEYMACGIPVLACSGIIESEKLIDQYRNGILMRCTAEDVALGIEAAISNLASLRETAIAIAPEIIERYSYRNIGSQLHSFLYSLERE